MGCSVYTDILLVHPMGISVFTICRMHSTGPHAPCRIFSPHAPYVTFCILLLHSGAAIENKLGELLFHRSDSNKFSDYIAIILSWISSFQRQHLQISNLQSVEN